MAQRRMFSPQIVGSEEFLTMPVSSQALYFHLGMHADDDGFIQPKITMRSVGSNDDDLKVLLSKRFLLPFEGGVVVIKHWLIHNLIQKDRYHPTRFQDEKKTLFIKENKAYSDSLSSVNRMLPEVRIGQDSLPAKAAFSIQREPKEDAPEKVPKDPLTPKYEALLQWAEGRRGHKFVNRVKQYSALKKARVIDISIGGLKDRWEALEGDSFYQERGFDWTSVVGTFDKKA